MTPRPAAVSAAELERSWARDPRWIGVERRYSAVDVVGLTAGVTGGRIPARRIHDALLRSDPVTLAEGGKGGADWLAAMLADTEGDLGPHLGAFEAAREMIAAGDTDVYVDDRREGEDGRLLVPAAHHVRSLNAARLAADVAGVPATIVARTGALADGLDAAVGRGLAYAPYADVVRFETARPDTTLVGIVADAVRAHFPERRLAFACPPPSGPGHAPDAADLAAFRRELAAMGLAERDETERVA